MIVKAAATQNETLQRYAEEYFAETGQETATAKEIAVWAIRTDRWQPPSDLLIRQCREEFAKALREQYIKDSHGRPVRAKHVARITEGDKQKHLWDDIQRAPRKHMEKAFQQRREQVVSDCRQLKRDVDFYNGLHPKNEPIQLIFDFRDDIEESEFPKQYPPRKPR